MTRSQSIHLFLLAALLTIPGAAAQTAPEAAELVTDRPDQTESAVVVPPGALQIELGASFARDEAGAARVESVELPGTLLRWGVARRLELRFAWPGQVEVESRAGRHRDELSGGGDPELGAKLALLSSATGAAFDLALLAHLSLPVGDEAVGSPRADPSIRLNGAHDLAPGLGLGWNVGYAAASVEDARGDVDTLGRFLYTAALGFELSPRWGAFVELFGDLPASDAGPAAHSLDGGVTYLLTPRLQIDAFAGFGLSDAADDRFAGFGVSIRVPR